MKAIKHLVAATLSLSVLTPLLTGCKNYIINNSTDKSEYVYTVKPILFPINPSTISNVAYYDEKIFFTVLDNGDVNATSDGEDFTWAATDISIYSMGIDGTDLTKLHEYIPKAIKYDDINISTSIRSMTVDSFSNLWIVEDWTNYRFDLPINFDMENDEPYNYVSIMDSGCNIRKLDETGAEQLVIDISSLIKQQGSLYVMAFTVAINPESGIEDIYIGCLNPDLSSLAIFAIDTKGNLQLQTETETVFSRFVHMPDGSIAYPTIPHYKLNNTKQELQKIDIAAGSLGRSIKIQSTGIVDIFNGGSEYDILISNNADIYGYSYSDGKSVKLMDWIDSGILADGIQDIFTVNDDIFLLTTFKWNSAQELEMGAYIATRTLLSELPEKAILTIAALREIPKEMLNAVIEFNSTNQNYKIDVAYFSERDIDGDPYAGLTRLTTEIIAGKIPDILYTSELPYTEFARKGLFANLYEFIDTDNDYDRDDFIEPAFQSVEVDGSLYQIFPRFHFYTVIGRPADVGADMGWDINEFISCIEANPQYDVPVDYWLDKKVLLRNSLSLSLDEYINSDVGAAYFDTPDFINLLELVNRHPIEDYSAILTAGTNNNPYETIPSGRQLMRATSFFGYRDLLENKALFGGDIVFKGFPTKSRLGNALYAMDGFAITEASANKEIAWEFLRIILDKDWQLENCFGEFPTNKAALNHVTKMALETDYSTFSVNMGVKLENLTQEDVNQVMALIYASSGGVGETDRFSDERIWSIIWDDTVKFFRGECSAQDAAKVIQSRASIFVSEQD